ncbi:MAG: hypothetical protein K0A89_07935 [ANME-2 cluster archaeon]|nr:hypothetical protein [ANME-2 cluster archaeon]
MTIKTAYCIYLLLPDRDSIKFVGGLRKEVLPNLAEKIGRAKVEHQP